jgi:hypothetical protein
MSPKKLDLLLTQHAAECVEELLNTVHEPKQEPWFLIIKRKMRRLIKEASSRKARITNTTP